MITYQNILVILRPLLNLEKKLWKTLYQENFHSCYHVVCLTKIPNRKKISNEHFNLCEAAISLDEIIKSLNSEANNKSPANDGLTTDFYK